MLDTEKGCWIFLSHSSRDIGVVRNIRNAFERCGHNPLAFHLKCLKTDTEENRRELDDLIKREIDARDWFVFCESESANCSEYVKMEREYVKRKKKKVFHIDLSEPYESIIEKVDEICRTVYVLISCKGEDYLLASTLQSELLKLDVPSVIRCDDVEPCESEKALGFKQRIYLLTNNSEKSGHFKEKMKDDFESGKKTFVFSFFDFKKSEEIRNTLIEYGVKRLELVHVPTLPKIEDVRLLAAAYNAYLKVEINGAMNEFSDYTLALESLAEKVNYTGRYHLKRPTLGREGTAAIDYCDSVSFTCCGVHLFTNNIDSLSLYRADGCKSDNE